MAQTQRLLDREVIRYVLRQLFKRFQNNCQILGMLVDVSNNSNVLLCFVEVKVSRALMLLGPTLDFMNYTETTFYHIHTF